MPAGCPITYEYSLSDTAIDSIVTFYPQYHKFAIGTSNLIELAGDLYTDYTITLSAWIGDPTNVVASTTPATASFVLRVKNPCLDPEYV